MIGSKISRLAFGLLSSVYITISPPALAAQKLEPIECTVILDAGTGETLRREGTCDQRFSPMSSFKVPLALIGYDAGILVDEHTPTWDYKPEFNASKREQKSVDPTIWEKDSIVWFSQELTRKLGRQKFTDYIAKFDYDTAISPAIRERMTA